MPEILECRLVSLVAIVGDGAAGAQSRFSSLAGARVEARAILADHATVVPADIEVLSAATALLIAGPLDKMERSAMRRCLVAARAAGVRHCFLSGLSTQAAGAIRIFAIGAGFDSATVLSAQQDAGAAVRDALVGPLKAPAGGLARMTVEAAVGKRELRARLVTGAIVAGDEVVLLPDARVARIAAIAQPSVPGGSQVLTLDRDITAAAGDVLSHGVHRPEVADQVAAQVIWLSSKPMIAGRPYQVSLLGQKAGAQISTIKHAIDPETLGQVAARSFAAGEVGVCNISFERPLVFDPVDASRNTGQMVITDRETGSVAGFGYINFALRRATNIHWQALAVDKAARAILKGQKACCLWFTGLSGSGKSTVASLLEKRLHAMGRHTYTLDGDNVRHGLNRDLGFTDADRVENIRRVGEVAKLFVDAGDLVLVSFISPFQAERRMARELFKDGDFVEIYVDTPIEICEQRDPKGLYKKARAGQLKNFTGIDSAYEAPEKAEIVLRGGVKSAEALVEELIVALEARGRF